MAITAALVKTLRERTGAGMMECKKALVAVDGDIEKAVEEMRKSGAAKADKKAGRTAAEGLVVLDHDASTGLAALVEINSETDFVARDDNFVNFAKTVCARVLATRCHELEAFLKMPFVEGESQSIDDARKALIAKIGENVNIRRLTLVEAADDESLGVYSHGGRIGVLVQLKGDQSDLAKDVAMHIAAAQPAVCRPEEVPADMIEKEKVVFMGQAEQSGKPADIIEKMVQGRINKYLNEVSLLGQPYVKDTSMTVGQLLKNAKTDIVTFVRYEVGEGIEKKADNFVEEVMAQARGE